MEKFSMSLLKIDGLMFNSGRWLRIDHIRADILRLAYGMTLLAMKNAPILVINVKIVSGNIALCNEMPAALIAVSSNFSPRLP